MTTTTPSRRQFLLGATGALALTGVGACAGRDSRGKSRKSVAFAQPDTAGALYPLLLHGARQASQRRGYRLLQSHANSKLDTQVSEINTWIAQQVGGIIVLPLDNAAMQPLIAKAHRKDVKFLDYSDKALPGTDGYVIFDNQQGARLVGQHAAKWVKEKLGGQAKVALLTHDIQKTGRERIDGAVRALQAAAPGAKVVARHEGVLAADVLPVFQSMLQANGDIDVVICIADDGALGAERAFMQTRPSRARLDRMYITGFDGTVPVFKKIAAGSAIRSTGALDLIKIGAESVDATANAVEGKGQTRVNYPYVLVSQDNPDRTKEFLTRYAAATS